MVKIKYKIAQFYIIAAVILIVIIAGLVAIINYAYTRPEPAKFYDLSKQLEFETAKIIDYGVLQNEEVKTKIDDFIENFYLEYTKEKEPNAELIYIYGNETYAVIVNYGKDNIKITTDTGEEFSGYGSEREFQSSVSIDIGGKRVEKIIVEKQKEFKPFRVLLSPSQTRIVYINISNNIYEFELKSGQQFFAILRAEKEGERYVSETS